MLTMEALREYGANTAEGLGRCLNNETFYLRLVGMLTQDSNTKKLGEALDRGDLDAAFEAAHALKGVLSNLALTPALTPVNAITELLRSRTATDYAPLMADIRREMDRLIAMING